MKISSIAAELEKSDTIGISLEPATLQMKGSGSCKIMITGTGEIFVCNSQEERKYKLHKTPHGGFCLKEVHLP